MHSVLLCTFCAAWYVLFACVPAHGQYTHTNQRSKLVFKFLTSSWQEWERNLLIDDVVPYLQAFARRLGFEFRLAEMRWGIRADASSSHMTSEICMAELERCQRESQGFSYVFLGCVPHCFPSILLGQLMLRGPAGVRVRGLVLCAAHAPRKRLWWLHARD